MNRRDLPSFIKLWKRHTDLYVGVFSLALTELAENRAAPAAGDEDAISEKLCYILRCVCFNIGKSRNREIQTPDWEVPIQPVNREELKGGKIRKRPDFTCKLVNPFAESSEEHEISFHVECKRLGKSTSVSWNLNKNYVEDGIRRFDCPNHEYGKRAPSGMMIGYIIGMTPLEIEAEVNDYQEEYLPYFAGIRFNFDAGHPFRTLQGIKRRNINPKEFELVHLWIDLRI